MRINKYLASCGLASRRKAEELILGGKVVVNGNTIRELGFDIDEKHDKVYVNGTLAKLGSDKVYYMLNKPVGVISASSADHGDKTVIDLIDDKEHRLFPVGRLDKDSEGLIFITNDGDFAYMLTHPKFAKEKKYTAILKGMVDNRDLKKLLKGVMLDDKLATANSVRFLKDLKGNSLVEIVISEGRNRQVRRMCEIIGHPVLSLRRTSEAGVNLGELKIGEYRELTNEEVRMCMGKSSASFSKGKSFGKNKVNIKGGNKPMQSQAKPYKKSAFTKREK